MATILVVLMLLAAATFLALTVFRPGWKASASLDGGTGGGDGGWEGTGSREPRRPRPSADAAAAAAVPEPEMNLTVRAVDSDAA